MSDEGDHPVVVENVKSLLPLTSVREFFYKLVRSGCVVYRMSPVVRIRMSIRDSPFGFGLGFGFAIWVHDSVIIYMGGGPSLSLYVLTF